MVEIGKVERKVNKVPENVTSLSATEGHIPNDCPDFIFTLPHTCWSPTDKSELPVEVDKPLLSWHLSYKPMCNFSSFSKKKICSRDPVELVMY